LATAAKLARRTDYSAKCAELGDGRRWSAAKLDAIYHDEVLGSLSVLRAHAASMDVAFYDVPAAVPREEIALCHMQPSSRLG